MAAILEVADDPALADQTAFNLAVWEKVLADPFYASLEHRIETNSYGQIIMSPPPNFDHGSRQFNIGYLLKNFLEHGRIITECPVSTSAGIRAIDTAWASPERVQNDISSQTFTKAPEICVEVISPSNSNREMIEKKSLYFEAGAEEVWFCDAEGKMTFYLTAAPDSPVTSNLCPAFPLTIEID